MVDAPSSAPDRQVLSVRTRFLTRLAAVAFGLIGAVFFLAPGYSATNFPWNVSEFVAMTIGGWCLGTAIIAWEAARLARYPLVYPMLVYLWAFSIGEIAVVVAFASVLRTDANLTIPYLGALGIALLATISGLAELALQRPRLRQPGRRPGWVQGIVVFLFLFVGALTIPALVAQKGGSSTNGSIFPEPLTLFTLRAFGAFFLAIALSTLSLLFTRAIEPAVQLARVGIGLLAPITLASIIHVSAFDFVGRPGGLLYLGAYAGFLVLFIWAVIHFRRLGTAEPAGTNSS
jgi:hypothetical protein